jgi:uncharacterized membrane protein YhiD involved in acid resistance
VDDFLTVFSSARFLGVEEILSGMLLSFVLCSVFAAAYRWTFEGLSYSRTFVQTLVLGGMITCMMIMAIGNNLARGLGILGTLAIIRFRTPVREPRDMVFLFASLGVGIACGAHTFNVAIVGTLILSATILYLHWSPFASRRSYEGLLRFVVPTDASLEQQVTKVLEQCCSGFQVIAMREAVQGDALEYSYHVRLVDPSYQTDLVNQLQQISELSDASLLMQRSTVEL